MIRFTDQKNYGRRNGRELPIIPMPAKNKQSEMIRTSVTVRALDFSFFVMTTFGFMAL